MPLKPLPPLYHQAAIWVVAGIGLSVSVGSFLLIRDQTQEQQETEIQWVAHNRNSLLKKGLENALEPIRLIRDYLQAGSAGKDVDFPLATRPILERNPSIEMIGLVLGDAGRPATEATLTHAASAPNSRFQAGFRFAAEPHLAELLERAWRSDRLVVSQRLRLGQQRQNDYAVMAALPLKRPTGPACVVILLRLDQLAHLAISYLEPRGVDLLVLDESAAGPDRFLEYYASRLRPLSDFDESEVIRVFAIGAHHMTEAVQMGDRRWTVTAMPIGRFLSADAFSLGAWVVLSGGLLLTSLLTAYLLHVQAAGRERQRMNRLLSEREELFWQMTETVDDLFWAMNAADGRFLYLSPALEKAWGIPCDVAYADPERFIEGIHPEDRHIWRDGLRRARLGEQTGELCYRVIQPDGSLRWISDNPFPVTDADGRVRRVVGVAEDITEKRELQLKAIHNARLASIGVMATSVAHEINNPNNAINTAATLLEHAWDDALPLFRQTLREQGDFSLAGLSFAHEGEALAALPRDIRENARRIGDIVGNLKRLGSADPGRLDEIVDLNRVLQNAVRVLGGTIAKHTEHWSLDLARDPPPVRGNLRQLEQVCINIILNALQSLPDRQHGVAVETDADSEPGRVVVRFRDQGAGIAPTDAERVTEPFFTTRLERGGTGLGLYISQTIIDHHRGRLEIRSVPGEGTLVTLSFPAVAADADPEVDRQAPRLPPT